MAYMGLVILTLYCRYFYMDKKLLYLFPFILASCGIGEKKSPNVFFAGEIVNPTSKHVVLYKGDHLIDSTQLDKDNRFSFNLDSISDGLYHFNHAPELQYVYLEKGDSLMVRLNTIDFDESLVFSGRGEEINNFLLDLFLTDEVEVRDVYSIYYEMGPDDFKKRMDSLKNLKLLALKNLNGEVQLSDEAKEIAEASINYTYYNYKERYPFEHNKRMRKQAVDELPADFYDYRKDLSYNNNNLNYLRPYYNFMKSHIENLTYIGCKHDCVVKDNVVKNQLHFNRHRLKLIDSLVKENELKDNLLRNVAFSYLLWAKDKEENNRLFIDEFHRFSKNNRHLQEIDELYEGISNIQPNKSIPDLYVSNTHGENISLQQIASEGKTVFYFWSATEKKHFNAIAQRVLKLSKEKPEYNFVGINFMTDDANWKGMLESSGLDKKFQYKANNFNELTKALIVYPLNKCIITEDAKIVDAFATLYTSF